MVRESRVIPSEPGKDRDAIRVLLIDDDPDDRALAIVELERTLGRIEAVEASDSAAMERALSGAACDLVLTDYSLGWTDGLEVLRRVKALWPECAVVFFTGSGNERLAVEAMRLGLDDYVLKSGTHAIRLGVSALAAIERARVAAERRRIEERLRLEHAALSAAANAVAIADRDGVIVWANAAFSRLTGYAVDEVIGKNPRFLKSGRHDAAFYRSLWDTILSGKVWQGEVVNRRKDGTLYTEEMTVTPVPDVSGRVSHFIAVKQDVTERKHLHGLLVQSQRLETLGRLAGGLAHDFNNILQVIQGYIEDLLAGVSPRDPISPQLREMDLAAKRAAALTRQLLAFGRKHSMVREGVDLNALVTGLSTLLARLVGDTVRIEISPDPEVPIVLGDRGQLEQVVVNLVANARDAVGGSGRVAVGTTVATRGAASGLFPDDVPLGSYSCISVSDTGGGIRDDVLSHLFEPFVTTKEPGRGTGLGLSVVFGIVKQHGGWFDLATRQGVGTSVKVYLPSSTPSRPADGAEPDDREAPEAAAGVLVVDDDSRARAAMVQALAPSCREVIAVASEGAIAAAAGAARPPEIVVIDMLPERMDPLELVSGVQAAGVGHGVVAVSGFADALARWPVILDRGWQFLLAPFDGASLVRAARRALRTRKA